MSHPTQLDTLEIAHSQANQVGAVVLPVPRRRQMRTLDLDRRTAQRCCSIPVRDTVEARDQLAMLPLRLSHTPSHALTIREPQNPTVVVEQAFRRIGVGLYVYPPLDPEWGADSA